MRQKILVTGGAGFIGSNLCNQLASKYEVVALDNLLLGDSDNLNSEVTFINGDATVVSDLEACGDHFAGVFHLAGTSSAPMFTFSNLDQAYHNSILSFVRTLQLAVKTGAKKFFYASTSSLYGDNPMPLTEDQVVRPPNHYAVTKHCYEEIASCFSAEHPQLEIIGFRFMSVYGPHEEAKGEYANIVSQFIWDMARDLAPVIYGDGTQYRDFTNVADVIGAMTLALEHKQKLPQPIYNIGTGESASFNYIVQMINEIMKKNITPQTIPIPHSSYIPAQQADITQIRSDLGYHPQVDLRTGLAQQITNLKINKIRRTSSDALRV